MKGAPCLEGRLARVSRAGTAELGRGPIAVAGARERRQVDGEGERCEEERSA